MGSTHGIQGSRLAAGWGDCYHGSSRALGAAAGRGLSTTCVSAFKGGQAARRRTRQPGLRRRKPGPGERKPWESPTSGPGVPHFQARDAPTSSQPRGVPHFRPRVSPTSGPPLWPQESPTSGPGGPLLLALGCPPLPAPHFRSRGVPHFGPRMSPTSGPGVPHFQPWGVPRAHRLISAETRSFLRGPRLPLFGIMEAAFRLAF